MPDASAIDTALLMQEPYIHENYNQTYLYALPRNSRGVYVIWEISEAAKDHLRQKFGEHFFDNNFLTLRIVRTGDGKFVDVEDFIGDKNNYWVNVEPDCEYEMQLGYRAKGTTFFEHVATSNKVRTQPETETLLETQNEWRRVDVPNYCKEVFVDTTQWRFNQFEYWKRGKIAGRGPADGCWALVLHMHLPFVKHPEYPTALEEQWLFEAITNCYAPLLDMFWRLDREKIDFRLTVSLSPPLISMLSDELLQEKYRTFLREAISLAERELDAHRGKAFQHTIEKNLERLHTAKGVFDGYGGHILNGFRDFQNLEKVEVIICAGTHPTLPFYMHYPENIRAHIQLACRQYERFFGRWPRGMWLPENAFTPGLDKYLAENGIRWTLVNATGMSRGNTRAYFGTARPVVTHNGLAVFGIDEETRSQVWSRESGYPGDGRYKEWYRDVGYDMAWEHLPDYWKTAGVRRMTGLKYYRITSKETPPHEKQAYHPEMARQAVEEQSTQFVEHRGAQVEYLKRKFNQIPIVVSAYDAELFGHWWEEGPAWIEAVMRKMCCDQARVRPVTPSEFLCEHPSHQLMMPGASTWGKNSTFETWLDSREYQPNAWMYRHMFRAIEDMATLATQHKNAEGIEKRALNQAARETILAQASDWPFLISMGQSIRYAEVRLIRHISRARELIRQIQCGQIDETYLHTLEVADSLLKEDMDFRVFSKTL